MPAGARGLMGNTAGVSLKSEPSSPAGSCRGKECSDTLRQPRYYTEEEVARHDDPCSDLWCIIGTEVYDCTEFQHRHPGGAGFFTERPGGDVNGSWELSYHPEHYLKKLRHVGSLKTTQEENVQGSGRRRRSGSTSLSSLCTTAQCTNSLEMATPHEILNQGADPSIYGRWLQCDVLSKKPLGPDAFLFSIKAYSGDDGELDELPELPVCHHIYLRSDIPEFSEENSAKEISPPHCATQLPQTSRSVERAYSPVRYNAQEGTFEIAVRIYDGIPKGIFSNLLKDYEEGEASLQVSRPRGHFTRLSCGVYEVMERKIRGVRRIGIVAMGTGITPFIRLLRAIFNDEDGDADGYGDDKEHVVLLYASRTNENAIFSNELEHMRLASGGRLKVSMFTEGRRITEETILKLMPPASDDTIALVCGSPTFASELCVPALRGARYPSSTVCVL